MNDDAILRTLQSELAEIETRAKRLRGAIAAIRGESESPGRQTAGLDAVVSSVVATESPLSDLSALSQVDAVHAVLSAAGRPLVKADIVKAAAERGKVITISSLPSLLSRNKDQFRSAGGGHWELTAEASI